MTNKELADQLDNWVAAESETFREAARRLRKLPDSVPSLEDEMRRVVEKHKCLSDHLSYMSNNGQWNHGPWLWDFNGDSASGCTLGNSAALTVIRGIVKAKCDERNAEWRRTELESAINDGLPWYFTFQGNFYYSPTELAAIDALLTAMDQ